MNFKTILSVMLFFCLTGKLYSVNPWMQQPRVTVNDLRSCFFTDSLNGWISGDSGLILHTSNKGLNWNAQFTGSDFYIFSLCFVNQRLGFGLTWQVTDTPPDFYGTRILSTTNGGINWTNSMFPDSNLFLQSICFLDSMNGFMGGTEGKIFYTTNAGHEWNLSVMDSGIVSGLPIRKIVFYDSYIGFAVGGVYDIAGVIYQTTNSGRNWNIQIVGPEPVSDLYIFDSLNSIGVGGDFEFGPSKVVSTNSGTDWNYHEFGIFGIANSIDFRTKSEGWISMGFVDSFLVSTNAGSNWSQTPAPDRARIYDIFFVDENNGWAVGDSGVILKYNSDINAISNNEIETGKSISLNQNYPNPFNPNTIISYELKYLSSVVLKVYDALGNEIRTLVDKKQNPGKHEINFESRNLPSGIYFYKIISTEAQSGKEYVLSKKMVLIK